MSKSTAVGTATAAVWSGTDSGFSIAEVDLPELAPGEVLVKIESATVCGSDLHTIAGHRPTPLPTILGHEAIGSVVETGGPVLTSSGYPLEVGQRITWTIGTSCGECRNCTRGVPQKCASVQKYGHEKMDGHWQLNGGFATHCHLLAGTGVVVLPDGLPDELSTPANCATATVVAAARRAGLRTDDVVVVLGCGMLGLTAVAYAKDKGAAKVIACDVNEARGALARQFGADAVCTPEDLARTVDEVSGGIGADIVFELSGNSRAVQSALGLVGIDGRVALVGSVSPAPEVSFEPSGFVKNLSTVIGSHNYKLDDLVEAIDFLTRVPTRNLFADLVPTRFELKDINEAIAEANLGTAPRIAITMP
ncbi:zinc-binding dehydrogenase [Arthrobacter tecti]